MQFWTTVTEILTQPKKFLAKLPKEKGIKKSFLYFMPLLAINIVLTFLIGRITTPFISSYLTNLLGAPVIESYGFGFELVMTIFGYGLGLGLVFLSVGILHVWIMLWGGKALYQKTFQLFVYTSTPSLLFSWIPLVGSFAWIYDMVLLIMGTPLIHKDISKTKAVWMYVIPVILLLIFYIFIGIVFFLVATSGLSSFVGQAFLT